MVALTPLEIYGIWMACWGGATLMGLYIWRETRPTEGVIERMDRVAHEKRLQRIRRNAEATKLMEDLAKEQYPPCPEPNPNPQLQNLLQQLQQNPLQGLGGNPFGFPPPGAHPPPPAPGSRE